MDTLIAPVPCQSVHHLAPLKQHGADCLSPAVHWNLVVAAGRHVVADLAVVVADHHVADLVTAADSVAVVAILRVVDSVAVVATLRVVDSVAVAATHCVVAGPAAAVNGSCQRRWHDSCHDTSGTVQLVAST